MSVRRLAEDDVQPSGFEFNSENAKWADRTIRKYPAGREQSAVIPLLMRAQEQEGWVTRAAIESVADMLGMPYIRALEVATFYTQFQLNPVGSRAHVQVCGTTPCMLRGSEALIDVCRRKIHHDQFETNEAGTLSWEEVECQGACVNAPMVMIFKDTYEDLTPERLEEIIDLFEAGKGADVPAGPQVDRIYSAPVGGRTTLLDDDGGKAPSSGKPSAKKASGAGAVPPSKAGKPVTSAPETDPSIETPSPEKADGGREEARTDDKEAAKASADGRTSDSTSGSATASTVKGSDVGRARSNPTMDVAGTAKSHSAPKARAAGRKDDRPNATMKIAQSAKGAGAAESGGPPAMERPDEPDDLKSIAGIGPKIEEKLHGLGIWTWRQIANLKKSERDWLDAQLNFHGRIEREEWVKQAKALAKGGEAEYVKVFGKLPR